MKDDLSNTRPPFPFHSKDWKWHQLEGKRAMDQLIGSEKWGKRGKGGNND